MRAPISWLAEHADLPAGVTPRQVADAIVGVGIEVEKVEAAGEGLTGPLVLGRVLTFTPEPQKNGKTIRWCQVDVGEPEPRGIVCGASNFAIDDIVVVALPGAVLPGDFAISARKTYGHVSDGMICSVRELGIGDDHDGILVLPSGTPGDDARAALGLDDAVLDIAVTTDRGYTLSIRGLARETASALGTPFHDITATLPPVDGGAYPVTVDDPTGCDRFSARAVTGLDPTAPTPDWMAARLRACGMRSISLAVDVTNYVMLETGQPLHAFDRAKLRGPIGVRRAQAGETLTTLDDVTRTLHPDDLVVTDDSGAIALAGVMGGASTEIGAATRDVVLEAAHWEPAAIARTARRHRLPSEAARRVERGVDPQIAGVALQRCVDLLVEFGGATDAGGHTVVGDGPAPVRIALPVDRPGTTAGRPIGRDAVVKRLEEVGCAVSDGTDATDDVLEVVPPSWRPDLLGPADLDEEVIRLEGYDTIPSILPRARVGRGLTGEQALRRAVSRALAGAGYTEILSYPFVAPSVHDDFGLPADDPRRASVRLANPLSDAAPELRTSLLPGLLETLLRNVGRGSRNLALVETGAVFLSRGAHGPAPVPGIDTRPDPATLEALDAALPHQPRHVAVALCGLAEPAGWWGAGRAADWADAVEAAQVVARTARVELTVRQAEYAPWHPGRCAELVLGDRVVGHAGELHPRLIAAWGLPECTCAMELDLDAFAAPAPAPTPTLSTFPPVLLDVALVVDDAVPAETVVAAVRDGAGPLLEQVRLFDVYVNDALREARERSLAISLRFRAPDRTLTVDEATTARDAAVAMAAERTGARLRT
ncbi:MAG: phenylalanine--tRNA ligase subunit beta [Jatrophihabitans sp.]|uniref:phenylalanine--tRNA ligase subunit beta n=1 Tax=Jatrophihabitans sp. TaxID=1932789 RepID=UPI003F800AA4